MDNMIHGYTLLEPFKKVYDTYSRTEDAYRENYGYWMRKD